MESIPTFPSTVYVVQNQIPIKVHYYKTRTSSGDTKSYCVKLTYRRVSNNNQYHAYASARTLDKLFERRDVKIELLARRIAPLLIRDRLDAHLNFLPLQFLLWNEVEICKHLQISSTNGIRWMQLTDMATVLSDKSIDEIEAQDLCRALDAAKRTSNNPDDYDERRMIEMLYYFMACASVCGCIEDNPFDEAYNDYDRSHGGTVKNALSAFRAASVSNSVVKYLFARAEQNYQKDGRYLAVLFLLNGLNVNETCGLNMDDINQIDDPKEPFFTARISHEYVPSGLRSRRKHNYRNNTLLSSNFKYRLIPLHPLLRKMLLFWQKYYDGLCKSNDNLHLPAVCVGSYRPDRRPGRARPDDIIKFVNSLLLQAGFHPQESISLASGKIGTEDIEKTITYNPGTLLPGTLLTKISAKKLDRPQEGRYLLGHKISKTEGLFYRDWTEPRMQRAMYQHICRCYDFVTSKKVTYYLRKPRPDTVYKEAEDHE